MSIHPSCARITSTDAHYYVADHLGTAQMELDAGGNVIWQGQFAPFGQELDNPSGTAMNYKFTGLERDRGELVRSFTQTSVNVSYKDGGGWSPSHGALPQGSFA